jgi:2-keto-4-pentenoate hydratase/2-oxohepta-3-ene-1,7-dioic acid hydratase in catechol pathway
MKKVKLHDKDITPSKVICIGRNYVEHIKELNNEIPENMVIFNKPNSAVTNELKYFDEHTRFEAEICLMIEDNKIHAIGCGLDLTKANIQNYLKSKGLPWERAKAFDNSAVLSDFLTFDGKLEDLSMKLFVNNKLLQHATYKLMIYKLQNIVDEVQTFMSFEDGDIIMTGTPKGVSTYNIGDKFVLEVYHKEEVFIHKEWVVE